MRGRRGAAIGGTLPTKARESERGKDKQKKEKGTAMNGKVVRQHRERKTLASETEEEKTHRDQVRALRGESKGGRSRARGRDRKLCWKCLRMNNAFTKKQWHNKKDREVTQQNQLRKTGGGRRQAGRHSMIQECDLRVQKDEAKTHTHTEREAVGRVIDTKRQRERETERGTERQRDEDATGMPTGSFS